MIYLVAKVGVYLKGIYAVFTTENKAINQCILFAEEDRDDYHSWVVILCETNIANIPIEEDWQYGGFNNVIFETKKIMNE